MSPRFNKLILAAGVACMPFALHAQTPVGDLYSTVARVRGSVTLASGGTTVLSGSSIDPGERSALLVLNRGGNLTICQNTSLAVSASADGRNLMFSFGSGEIESRYSMNASSDVIITPDLRFVITGPGEFDLDIAITPQGDTCARSHRESTGGVIVNEQMGDGSYQIKPSDFVVFRKSRVANAEVNPAGVQCGCPAQKEPPRQTYVAETPKPPARVPPVPPTSLQEPLYPSSQNDHVVADAPFVFNGDGVEPAPTSRVMHLHVESKAFADLHPQVQPPPAKPAKKGFWHALAKLFS